MSKTDNREDILKRRWLINDPEKVIEDVLVGLVKCNPKLALLDTGPVVVRRDHLQLDQVKILSGCSSGHEPSFSGFVGKGMLTGSVQGSVYASPTPNLILKAIKELARRQDKGIMIIIGDNTGDRLNFGLAFERAKNIPNLKLRLLPVIDYCYKSDSRGLTGTLLIQKIAGAMAECKEYLVDIHLFCKALIENIATVLVSMQPAVSPYFEVSVCARPTAVDIEFGSGLHGQLGHARIQVLTTHEIVEMLLRHLTSSEFDKSITLDMKTPIVLLINNLGAFNTLESLIFVNEVISQLQSMKITIERIYCGTFMTSINMSGVSLTILKVIKPEVLTYLDMPCEAPFWKSYAEFAINPTTDVTIKCLLSPKEIQLKPYRGPMVKNDTAKIIDTVINFSCSALRSCDKQLNLIDSETGDADTGTNFSRFVFKILEASVKQQLKINWPFMLFQEISRLLEDCQGLLACFYAIMFESAAQVFFPLSETDPVNIHVWNKCLANACRTIQRYGRTSFGERTMYDPLFEASQALSNAIDANMPDIDAVGLMTVAAEEAASRTRLDEDTQPDPGAHAVGIWMRALYESLKLQGWQSIQEEIKSESTAKSEI